MWSSKVDCPNQTVKYSRGKLFAFHLARFWSCSEISCMYLWQWKWWYVVSSFGLCCSGHLFVAVAALGHAGAAKVAGGWLQSFLHLQWDLSMNCSSFLRRKAEEVGRGISTQLCFNSVHFYNPEQSSVGSSFVFHCGLFLLVWGSSCSLSCPKRCVERATHLKPCLANLTRPQKSVL